VLWHCSSRHRVFLPINFTWYPKILTPYVWMIIKQQSRQLKTVKQGQFLFDNIRIDGEREVKKVTHIFTASINGWDAEDFHRHCDGRGPTLCLFRSSENYLAAVFTSVSWSSPESEDGMDVEDSSAMVFALTNELQAFKTNSPKRAVYHNK